jgi:hypothetical protein
MNVTEPELTHPSWRRASEPDLPPRESLMSQMVRAQLIFDRRTPPQGMPMWRDADGDITPIHLDTRVGAGVGEFLIEDGPADGADVPTAGNATAEPTRFADELADRLQLACDRVEAEQVHLSQVGTVAEAYLGRPNLRLVK